MGALRREFKGDSEYLSNHRGDEQDAPDDASNLTALTLVGAVSGGMRSSFLASGVLMPRKKDPLQRQIDDLTELLVAQREKVMARAGYKAFGSREIASFHGTIGGKNNVYVDAIRQVFLSPDQFISEWKEGALADAGERDAHELKTYGRRYQNAAVHDIVRMLKDPVIGPYIDIFLERNFYKQHHARVRAKPEDALWEIWFGPKNQEYGLFITPRYRDDEWENDVSHIRRAVFEYWTIGHVLTSGFVVPSKPKVHTVASLADLFNLFQNVFVRSAGSVHAEGFAAAYVNFVSAQNDPLAIPFLIPEFRYEGATGPHKHRLDFTILSASRNLKVGIELSPWSTHGRVKDKKKLLAEGGEAAVEEQRIKQWETDTQKRNSYFEKFGITTLTFTDSDLADIDAAFARIIPYLAPPKKKPVAVPQVKRAVESYGFDAGNKKTLNLGDL